MNTIYVANLCCSIGQTSTTRIVNVRASADGSTFIVSITGKTINTENYPLCISVLESPLVEYASRKEALAAAQKEVDSLLQQQYAYSEDIDPTLKQLRMDNVEASRQRELLETRKEQTNDAAVKWELTQQQHPCLKQIAETDEKIKQRKKDIGFAF
jgi:hypothetical protein